MSEIKQFRLPDLGEGLTEADIVKWLVAVGDTVAENDLIAEVESVKAAVELPSPFAGVVTELHAEPGQTVPVGAPIISVRVGAGTPDAAAGDAAADDGATGGDTGGQQPEPTLVGYGPSESSGRRRRRPALHTPSAHTAFNIPPPSAVPAAPPEPDYPVSTWPPAPAAAPGGSRPAGGRARAKPPVRKLAKTLGVDLNQVPASGPDGTVSREDVHAAAQRPAARGAATGDETRIPIKGVRKHTAAATVASAFTAPHVTEFVTVDVTAMMDLRDRVAARPEFSGVKVSPLLFVAKAVILAAARTPEINASWDESAGEIVLKHYVNLGIAAATERGLIVPNITGADRMSLRELASALAELTAAARSGRTSPQEMTGGTITITNVGVFGVDTGTPIINPGEAAIVAFGAVRRMPWVVGTDAEEHIEPRWVTQLAVSFDHRLVDGQQGSRFLADVAAVLADPGMALL